jgi:hypothetical protein
MARLTVIYEPDKRPPLRVIDDGTVKIASIDIGDASVSDINIYAVAQKLAELLLEQLSANQH